MGRHLMIKHLMAGTFMGKYLMGRHLMGRHLMIKHLMAGTFMGKYLMGRHLMGRHLMGRHLMGKYLMGKHLMGKHLMGRHLMGKHLIYESSLRAEPGWRESLYRHQGCLEASDCGRLGRQAAWSPLERAPRGEKLPKRLPNGLGAAEAKQQLCIPDGTRAH